MSEKNPIAAKLRELATDVRRKQNANSEIALAFELIADAMEPCFDCGSVAVVEGAAAELANSVTGDTGGHLDNTTTSAQAA